MYLVIEIEIVILIQIKNLHLNEYKVLSHSWEGNNFQSENKIDSPPFLISNNIYNLHHIHNLTVP